MQNVPDAHIDCKYVDDDGNEYYQLLDLSEEMAIWYTAAATVQNRTGQKYDTHENIELIKVEYQILKKKAVRCKLRQMSRG